jgi:hypothetical protein
MNAAYDNNRSIEVNFTITQFSRFIDTTIIDSTGDGGYLALGNSTLPAETFQFTSNGTYTAQFNTGSTSNLRFYGQNAEYELDIVNVTYTDGDDRFLFFTEGQELDIDEIGQFTHGFAVTKWKNITSDGVPGSDPTGDFADTDHPMFRLADVYLMYAEAAARSNQNTGQGRIYLNVVRERAGAGQLNNYDAEAVRDERARELYWEGSRRTDPVRFNRYLGDNYLWPWKGGVQEGQAVGAFRKWYPLPPSDLTANPKLTQNEGY